MATTADISTFTDSETALVVPAPMQELHWHLCWAEEPGYADDNPLEDRDS